MTATQEPISADKVPGRATTLTDPGTPPSAPPALSGAQLTALAGLARLRHRRGDDWYGGGGWGGTLTALERRGLAATRRSHITRQIIARATDAGLRELARRGIPWT